MAGSDWAGDTGLSSVDTVEAYRRRVPLHEYRDIHPYIERLIQGERTALLSPDQPLHMFALTSGTTGQAKHIPVTGDYMDAYRRGWQIWGYRVYKQDKRPYDRKLLQVVSTACEWSTPGGVPCGAVSGYTASIQPWLIRKSYAAPIDVVDIRDYTARYYTLMRLVVPADLSMINTPNPSTVLKLVSTAEEQAERLIRDIHDGTLSPPGEIPREVHDRIACRLKPNPRLARKLQRMIGLRGRLLPMDYWPNLCLLANWTGGTMGHYITRYPDYFGDLPVQELGLLASEGRLSIPMHMGDDHAGPLDVLHHLFEFIPMEAGPDSNDTVGIREVEQGRRYFLVPTSPGGLLRYRIHDLVEVVDFFNQAPVIRFLNKGSNFSSLAGEKLSEHQVHEALGRACSTMGRPVMQAVFTPRWDDPPRYVLVMEPTDPPTEPGDLQLLLAHFDAALQELNLEYRSRRSSQRLDPPILALATPGTFEVLRLDKVRHGNYEQYKHPYLVPDPETLSRFDIVETLPYPDGVVDPLNCETRHA